MSWTPQVRPIDSSQFRAVTEKNGRTTYHGPGGQRVSEEKMKAILANLPRSSSGSAGGSTPRSAIPENTPSKDPQRKGSNSVAKKDIVVENLVTYNRQGGFDNTGDATETTESLNHERNMLRSQNTGHSASPPSGLDSVPSRPSQKPGRASAKVAQPSRDPSKQKKIEAQATYIARYSKEQAATNEDSTAARRTAVSNESSGSEARTRASSSPQPRASSATAAIPKSPILTSAKAAPLRSSSLQDIHTHRDYVSQSIPGSVGSRRPGPSSIHDGSQRRSGHGPTAAKPASGTSKASPLQVPLLMSKGGPRESCSTQPVPPVTDVRIAKPSHGKTIDASGNRSRSADPYVKKISTTAARISSIASPFYTSPAASATAVAVANRASLESEKSLSPSTAAKSSRTAPTLSQGPSMSDGNLYISSPSRYQAVTARAGQNTIPPPSSSAHTTQPLTKSVPHASSSYSLHKATTSEHNQDLSALDLQDTTNHLQNPDELLTAHRMAEQCPESKQSPALSMTARPSGSIATQAIPSHKARAATAGGATTRSVESNPIVGASDFVQSLGQSSDCMDGDHTQPLISTLPVLADAASYESPAIRPSPSHSDVHAKERSAPTSAECQASQRRDSERVETDVADGALSMSSTADASSDVGGPCDPRAIDTSGAKPRQRHQHENQAHLGSSNVVSNATSSLPSTSSAVPSTREPAAQETSHSTTPVATQGSATAASVPASPVALAPAPALLSSSSPSVASPVGDGSCVSPCTPSSVSAEDEARLAQWCKEKHLPDNVIAALRSEGIQSMQQLLCRSRWRVLLMVMRFDRKTFARFMDAFDALLAQSSKAAAGVSSRSPGDECSSEAIPLSPQLPSSSLSQPHSHDSAAQETSHSTTPVATQGSTTAASVPPFPVPPSSVALAPAPALLSSSSASVTAPVGDGSCVSPCTPSSVSAEDEARLAQWCKEKHLPDNVIAALRSEGIQSMQQLLCRSRWRVLLMVMCVDSGMVARFMDAFDALLAQSSEAAAGVSSRSPGDECSSEAIPLSPQLPSSSLSQPHSHDSAAQETSYSTTPVATQGSTTAASFPPFPVPPSPVALAPAPALLPSSSASVTAPVGDGSCVSPCTPSSVSAEDEARLAQWCKEKHLPDNVIAALRSEGIQSMQQLLCRSRWRVVLMVMRLDRKTFARFMDAFDALLAQSSEAAAGVSSRSPGDECSSEAIPLSPQLPSSSLSQPHSHDSAAQKTSHSTTPVATQGSATAASDPPPLIPPLPSLALATSSFVPLFISSSSPPALAPASALTGSSLASTTHRGSNTADHDTTSSGTSWPGGDMASVAQPDSIATMTSTLVPYGAEYDAFSHISDATVLWPSLHVERSPSRKARAATAGGATTRSVESNPIVGASDFVQSLGQSSDCMDGDHTQPLTSTLPVLADAASYESPAIRPSPSHSDVHAKERSAPTSAECQASQRRDSERVETDVADGALSMSSTADASSDVGGPCDPRAIDTSGAKPRQRHQHENQAHLGSSNVVSKATSSLPSTSSAVPSTREPAAQETSHSTTSVATQGSATAASVPTSPVAATPVTPVALAPAPALLSSSSASVTAPVGGGSCVSPCTPSSVSAEDEARLAQWCKEKHLPDNVIAALHSEGIQSMQQLKDTPSDRLQSMAAGFKGVTKNKFLVGIATLSASGSSEVAATSSSRRRTGEGSSVTSTSSPGKLPSTSSAVPSTREPAAQETSHSTTPVATQGSATAASIPASPVAATPVTPVALAPAPALLPSSSPSVASPVGDGSCVSPCTPSSVSAEDEARLAQWCKEKHLPDNVIAALRSEGIQSMQQLKDTPSDRLQSMAAGFKGVTKNKFLVGIATLSPGDTFSAATSFSSFSVSSRCSSSPGSYFGSSTRYTASHSTSMLSNSSQGRPGDIEVYVSPLDRDLTPEQLELELEKELMHIGTISSLQCSSAFIRTASADRVINQSRYRHHQRARELQELLRLASRSVQTLSKAYPHQSHRSASKDNLSWKEGEEVSIYDYSVKEQGPSMLDGDSYDSRPCSETTSIDAMKAKRIKRLNDAAEASRKERQAIIDRDRRMEEERLRKLKTGDFWECIVCKKANLELRVKCEDCNTMRRHTDTPPRRHGGHSGC